MYVHRESSILRERFMCGICGFVTRDMNRPVDEDRLRAMMGKLSHRGPDASGVYIGPGGKHVALGHNRLAVIDLETGDQPMRSPTGRTTVVYNGECYNYRELRVDLEAKGVTFRTQSDTEVVAALVAERGVDAPGFLNGQFAFAAWDENTRTLLLARDPLGQKPLFYHDDGKRFAFASSLAALLACGDVPREIDPEAVDLYLTFGYIPAPKTIFRNVRKLLPGTTLTLQGDTLTEDSYLKPDDEAPDDLKALIADAVRARLISDVPLGAWLSGGIDSSIIVALMSELTDEPVKTFAIGFGDPLYDELAYARAVAERYGTDHHEFVVAPKCTEALEKLVPLFGEPFADSSAIPTWTLSRETRAHVKVTLSGDGGDELFGGYDRYRAMLLAERFGGWPRCMRSLAKSIAGTSGEQRSRRYRLRRFLDAIEKDPVERYLAWMSIFDSDTRAQLSDGEPCAEDYLREAFARNTDGTSAGRAMRVDQETYLPGDLLVKTDVASLAFGLEVRCPFLDPRLVALARRMPTKQKLSMFTGKRILRKVFRDKLPAKVRRRKKMGFGVPLGRWFRTDLREMLSDVLLSQRARERGILKPHAVQGLIEEHLAEHADHSARLYALLFLELWFREFVD